MISTNSHSRGRGFSLIEVLVAVVVLSVGILALGLLQISLVRSSASTTAQSVALSLAKGKLEEMRTFATIADYQASTDSTSSEALSVGGLSYSRSWTVDRFASPISGGEFAAIADTGATPAGYTADNEFKVIRVSVSWQDPTGATHDVTLDDAIGANDPVDSAKLAKPLKSTRPRGPEVLMVNPEAVAGIIPIALGNGRDTAATNPRPIIVGQGSNSSVVETRFDVLTYLALSDEQAIGQLRVETAVVGCSCTASAAANAGFRPAYWNGSRYVPPAPYTYATTGFPTPGVTQSDRCLACCRDHHDPSAVSTNPDEPLFDRRRTDGHKHFNTDLASEVSAGVYREACRMVRVDGFWRTAADLQNDYFGVLATGNNNDDTIPDAAMASNYEAFALAYLDARYVNGPTANFNNPSAYTATISSAESIHHINDPATNVTILPSATEPKWTHSRGLYIDYLETEARDLMESAKTNCGVNRACLLKYASFASINLTEIADWKATDAASPFEVNTTNIQVANNLFATSVTDLNPVAGKVLPGTAPVAGALGNAKSMITASNSGIALFLPVDPDTDNAVLSDAQTFQIDPGTVTPPGGGSFGLTMTGAIAAPVDAGVSANPPKVTFTINAIAVDCSKNGLLVLPYSCSTTTGQLLGGSVGFQVANYNRQLDSSNGVAVQNACQNGSGPANNIRMPYRIIMDAIGATSSNGDALVSGLTVNNPNGVGLPIAGGEYTTFTVTPVAAPISPATLSADTITVNMGNKLFKCPDNYATFITDSGTDAGRNPTDSQCGGNNNNGTPQWSATYGACPTGAGTIFP